jgi:hypothetical protein
MAPFVTPLPAIHGLQRCTLRNRRSWMTGSEAELFPRPCTTLSIAAPRSKARMFEHRDVRVRAGPLGTRSAGKLRQHDVAETVVHGRMALVTFPERKATRSPWRRAESRQGCRTCPRMVGHHPHFGNPFRLDPGLRRDDAQDSGALAPGQGVHLRCAWIDITTPNPVSRVMAEVPP